MLMSAAEAVRKNGLYVKHRLQPGEEWKNINNNGMVHILAVTEGSVTGTKKPTGNYSEPVELEAGDTLTVIAYTSLFLTAGEAGAVMYYGLKKY